MMKIAPIGFILGLSFWMINPIAAIAIPLEEIDPEIETRIRENPLFREWQNVELFSSLEGHNSPVLALAFSPDSRTLASGGGEMDGKIHLWDIERGRSFAEERRQQARVTDIAIAADGNMLASSGDVRGVSLWKWEDSDRDRIVLGHAHNILALAIAPDSRVLASGGLDGIRLWDLENLRPLYTLVRFDVIRALAIHPNGYILASGGENGKIKLWNLRTGEIVLEIDAHENSINTLGFTPNGQLLISGSKDRKIKIWRSATGELRNTLTGHGGAIEAIAIHPSGLLLASGSRDGIRLWTTETGELINNFAEHSDWIEALAFSPDGAILASGGFDRQVNLWRPIRQDWTGDR